MMYQHNTNIYSLKYESSEIVTHGDKYAIFIFLEKFL